MNDTQIREMLLEIFEEVDFDIWEQEDPEDALDRLTAIVKEHLEEVYE